VNEKVQKKLTRMNKPFKVPGVFLKSYSPVKSRPGEYDNIFIA